MLRKAIDWSNKKANDRESNSDRSNTGNNDQIWEEVPATGTCVWFTHQTATSTSVLYQRVKIINKLRPLHLKHEDRIVLSGIYCPKVKLYLVKSSPYKVKHIGGFPKQLGSIVPVMLARIP